MLRNDLLPEAFLVPPKSVRVIADSEFSILVDRAVKYERTKTPQQAKNIVETMSLIQRAIQDYEARTNTNEGAKLEVTYGKPDTDRIVETVAIELTRREPGMWGQGRPFESDVKALRPILRDSFEDPEHPGYRRAVLGYFYDNILTLTCWARTNKAANDRALWLENVMEEYAWFFAYSGVNRFLYQGRRKEEIVDVNNNKYYGRPIDFFVRTEKIREVSEKTLEEITIRMGLVMTA